MAFKITNDEHRESPRGCDMSNGIKLRALAEALTQYVENSEDVEDQLGPLDRALLSAARELLLDAERELSALAS